MSNKKEALIEEGKKYPPNRSRWALRHLTCSLCNTIIPKCNSNFCWNCEASTIDTKTIEATRNQEFIREYDNEWFSGIKNEESL